MPKRVRARRNAHLSRRRLFRPFVAWWSRLVRRWTIFKRILVGSQIRRRRRRWRTCHRIA